MKLKTILVVALTAILMGACCPCKKYQKKYGRPLQQTEWSMIQMDGRSFVAGDNYTIVFGDDGRLSGVGDCNRLMGSYVAETGSGMMKINNIASTRAFCPNQAQETAFVTMLSSVDSYSLDGPKMMLFKDSELVAVFEAKKEAPKK